MMTFVENYNRERVAKYCVTCFCMNSIHATFGKESHVVTVNCNRSTEICQIMFLPNNTWE